MLIKGLKCVFRARSCIHYLGHLRSPPRTLLPGFDRRRDSLDVVVIFF